MKVFIWNLERQMVLGQSPPRIIAPWMIVPGQLFQRKITPRKISPPPHHKVSLENNSPHSGKPPKEYYEWTEENYALSTSAIIYE